MDHAGTAAPEADLTKDLERRRHRWPLVVLVLVLALSLGWLFFTMFGRAVVYYRTPTEVLANPGATVRLSGTVVPGSIRFATARGTVSFEVTDGHSTVPVSFGGAAPDTLKDRAQAVAEGRLGSDGVFHASSVIARCPSKFQASPGG